MPCNPYDLELDPRYSAEGARAASWTRTRGALAGAELYWISTVRPGPVPRPHLTPVAGAWYDGALWFCSLPQERKVRNLLRNARCTLLTGNNALSGGTDIALEGTAEHVTDDRRIEAAARVFRAKYGAAWDYVVDGGELSGAIGRAWAFAVAPETVFAFSKDPMAQTRWRFTA